MNLDERFEVSALVADFRVIRRYTQDTAPFYSFESGQATIGPMGSSVVGWTPANSQLNIGNPATDTFLQSEINRDQIVAGVRFLSYFQRRQAHPTLLNFQSSVTARMSYIGREGQPIYLYNVIIDEFGGYNETQSVASAAFDRTRHLLYGTRTFSDELPMSGQRNYTTSLDAKYGGNRTLPVFARDQTVSIDFATGRVTGRFLAETQAGAEGPELPSSIAFVLDANFDRRGEAIAGTLRSEDGTITGDVRGHLFGPGGAALGLAVAMVSDSGRRPVGGVILGLPASR